MSCLMAACGSGDEGPATSKDIDPEIPCQSDNCGESHFRRAVPSRETVRIQFAGAAQRYIHPGPSDRAAPGIGRARQALAAQSPQLIATEQYVANINATVDELFESFESLASTTPEEQTDLVHVWRQVSEDDDTLDELLVVTAIDERSFSLELLLGETGIQVDDGVSIITGEVHLDDNEDKTDFRLVIDLDAASSVVPALAATGDIILSAQPLAGGIREVWYDFEAVGEVGGPTETSRTTYWIFASDDGALEYVAAQHDEIATVFVRWDQEGGRYDHHVQWNSELYGLVDEIATNCWDDSGAELFDGYALIDANLSYYGELDGDEVDCAFGPVDGHPNPTAEFDDLPAEGEWQDLELGADPVEDCDLDLDPFADACPPLCADDPSAVDCIPWCEDEPGSPTCIYYCDWFSDPEFCF